MPMMPRAAVEFRRYAILCHRWMGVALSVLFAAWFVSGIVLMYCEYPVVRARDRLARAVPWMPAASASPPSKLMRA